MLAEHNMVGSQFDLLKGQETEEGNWRGDGKSFHRL